MSLKSSRPARLRWQRHQNSLNIAAGFQPEDRPSVIKQVKLNISASPHQLMVAVILGEGRCHAPPHKFGIDLQKGESYISHESKFTIEIAVIEIVIENPSRTSRLLPVLEPEIVIAPFFIGGVIFRVMSIAGGFKPSVEIMSIGLIGHDWR